MASRDERKKIQTTGRQPDGNWMDLRHDRPTWMGKESRNTVDSGRESMEGHLASLPSRTGRRKRHADDDTPRRAYADIPKGAGNAQWNGPHKRILFESEDQESTLSESETQEAGPGWPPDDVCADSTRYKGSSNDRVREGLRLLNPSFQNSAQVTEGLRGSQSGVTILSRQTGGQSGCCREPTAVYIDTRSML